jgi:molybdate transport system ATP-binding protein
MATTLINIKQATIGYSGQNILSDFSLDINAGQHWAFTGESGSGKTTLLNAIAGNLQLKKGGISRYLSGETVGIEPDYHQLIAFVAAKHHFRNLSNTSDFYYQQRYNSSDSEDALTVTDYLQNIKSTGFTWTLERVMQLLRLDLLADKQLIKLSNGETKRLMMAAALLKNPTLLLLDNPLAGLDVQTREAFDGILAEIAATGITIAMATSQHEIPGIITNVGVLKDGLLNTMVKADYKPDDISPKENLIANINLGELLDRYPAPAYNTIAQMRNVHIQYGPKVILDGLNWQINQGERWALMGPNGAGKSTLLSLINGDNPQAYANDIILFDKKRGSGESIWDIKKKTGFISPEFYQYFPADSSCLQAIESGYYDTMGLFRPSDKARADRALQWMKVLEIDQYARQLLKNIPASAQRLCLLARAMIKNPVLLILDEPCQGMDDHQVQYFKALVDTICRATNITLIYVTHYAGHIPDSVGKTLRLSPPPPEGGVI